MIETLIAIIILCVIAGLIYWLVSLLPLPAPFPTIIQVCVILIILLYAVGLLFGGVSLPRLR